MDCFEMAWCKIMGYEDPISFRKVSGGDGNRGIRMAEEECWEM